MRRNALGYENNANNICFFIHKGMLSWIKCSMPKQMVALKAAGKEVLKFNNIQGAMSENFKGITTVLTDSLMKSKIQ